VYQRNESCGYYLSSRSDLKQITVASRKTQRLHGGHSRDFINNGRLYPVGKITLQD